MCQNNGTCSIEKNGTIYCDCSEKFSGKLCEISVFDACFNQTCNGQGVCSSFGPNIDDYNCSCNRK